MGLELRGRGELGNDIGSHWVQVVFKVNGAKGVS